MDAHSGIRWHWRPTHRTGDGRRGARHRDRSRGVVERYGLSLPFICLPSQSPLFLGLALVVTLDVAKRRLLILSSPTAMSRRIATDQGGKRGPQSSRGGNHGSNRDQNERRGDRGGVNANSNPNNIPLPSTFSASGANTATFPSAMPILPPGFSFPFPQQQSTTSQGK